VIQKSEIRVTFSDHHRNGVGGAPFWVVLFGWRDDDGKDRNMVSIVWDEQGGCAVLDADETAGGNVAFAEGNSWRGDHFEPVLKQYLKERHDAEF